MKFNIIVGVVWLFCSMSYGEDAFAPVHADTLVERVIRTIDEPSLEKTEFIKGLSSWNQSDWLAARNSWVRVLALIKVKPRLNKKLTEDMQLLVRAAHSHAFPLQEPIPKNSEISMKRGRDKNKIELPSNDNQSFQAKDIEVIMAQSIKAREAGQWEKAERLMRIADGLSERDKLNNEN